MLFWWPCSWSVTNLRFPLDRFVVRYAVRNPEDISRFWLIAVSGGSLWELSSVGNFGAPGDYGENQFLWIGLS